MEKIFTERSARIHTIVRCAQGKGLTGIVLKRKTSVVASVRGWYLACHQFEEKHFEALTAKQVCRAIEAGMLTDEGNGFTFKI